VGGNFLAGANLEGSGGVFEAAHGEWRIVGRPGFGDRILGEGKEENKNGNFTRMLLLPPQTGY